MVSLSLWTVQRPSLAILFQKCDLTSGSIPRTSGYDTALALDLVEEFRPVIVDSVVLNLLNNRMLTSHDFVVELGAYRLKQEKRTLFFTRFEERLNEEVQHPLFGYKTSYRRCIELQARLLAKYLTGEIESYPPLRIR